MLVCIRMLCVALFLTAGSASLESPQRQLFPAVSECIRGFQYLHTKLQDSWPTFVQIANIYAADSSTVARQTCQLDTFSISFHYFLFAR